MLRTRAKRKCSTTLLVFLAAVVAAASGATLPSGVSMSGYMGMNPRGQSARHHAHHRSSSPVEEESSSGGGGQGDSVSPYDYCNITAYRDAQLGEDDSCFMCVVAWQCAWCYTVGGKGRCMDPHTEKHRFTCTNVAKGGSNACTGASMPAGYVVLIVLACLMPLACLLYHYRARIRDLFESMKVPVALPEAEYSPERDPEVPMVTAHTREESVRQLGRAVNDNDDDRDHLPAPAPPTATRPASLTGASARMGLFASLASSRPSTATLIGSSPPLPQATEVVLSAPPLTPNALSSPPSSPSALR